MEEAAARLRAQMDVASARLPGARAVDTPLPGNHATPSPMRWRGRLRTPAQSRAWRAYGWLLNCIHRCRLLAGGRSLCEAGSLAVLSGLRFGGEARREAMRVPRSVR